MSTLDRLPYLVAVDATLAKSNAPALSAFVTCRTGEDTFRYGPFAATLALRKFHLNFDIDGGKAPTESWRFDESRPESVKIKVQRKHGSRSASSTTAKTSAKLGVALSAEAKLSADAGWKQSTDIIQNETFNTKINLVTARGNEKSPSWTFLSQPGEENIIGNILKNEVLFKIEPKTKTLNLRIEIEIPNGGLTFADKHGTHRTHINKRSLFKIVLNKILTGKHFVFAKEFDTGNISE